MRTGIAEGTFKKIIKFFLWIAGAFILLLVLTDILKAKWMRGDMETPPYTEIVEGFFDEPEDSLDVVFIGSSHVYCDINPLYLWKNYGITSYDFSITTQTVDCSYYYMQEMFKHQAPKVVFFEVWRYKGVWDMAEEHNRAAYDYMPNTIEKWETLRTLLQNQGARGKVRLAMSFRL